MQEFIERILEGVNRFSLYSLMLLLLLGFSGCDFRGVQVGLVIHNGTIIDPLQGTAVAQALAVSDGKIIEVGTERQILNKYRATELVDLRGGVLYPGLIDAHSHLLGYGLGLNQVDLKGTRSWAEVLERALVHAKGLGDSQAWLTGRGWDQNDWVIQEFPNREALDALFPDRPVALRRIGGHTTLANATALQLAGIAVEAGSSGVFEVEGGEIVRMADGVATGVLIDNAGDLISDVIPVPDEEAKTRALLAAQAEIFAVGLTTVGDIGLPYEDIELIHRLQESGQLKLRVCAAASDTPENQAHFLANGPLITDRLRAQSFKFYMDGALGSRGAVLLAPYADRPDWSGLVLTPPDSMLARLHLLKAAGFQAMTHCIGDSAVRMVLGMYEEVLGGVNDERWRIEHAQVVHKDDVSRFAGASVIPSIQPTHATSDMYWAGERLGRNRVRRAYAYKELLAPLGMVALGTDFPIEEIAPILTFYAATARKDGVGFPEGGFQPENALSPHQALLGMTLWAAMACHWDEDIGTIAPGKWADFVWIDRNWLTCAPEEVLDTKIRGTWVAGERVFQPTFAP
jgi:predicted amidohydrolase YtcJ